MAKKKPERTLKQTFPYILIVGGVIGLVSAVILMVEKIHLLKNPNAVLSCDVNPVVACGSVIGTPQASVFGFPNPVLGIAGFAIVITVGMALLAGASFKRWFWQGLQAGAVFGVGFVFWLQFQSVYRIGALCPYCMVVWSVTIPIFLYVTLYNLREGHIKTPPKLKGVVAFAQKHHGDILVAWYLIIAGLILHHFWYYWSTVL